MKLIYATFPTHEEAIETARTLLSEKLIACANVLPSATSVYRWQGNIQEQSEAILYAKTTAEKSTSAIERINALHSYDVPCILVLPVESGSAEFIKWVAREVSN
jgi:periplasmic divalent cation tolerance protein